MDDFSKQWWLNKQWNSNYYEILNLLFLAVESRKHLYVREIVHENKQLPPQDSHTYGEESSSTCGSTTSHWHSSIQPQIASIAATRCSTFGSSPVTFQPSPSSPPTSPPPPTASQWSSTSRRNQSAPSQSKSALTNPSNQNTSIKSTPPRHSRCPSTQPHTAPRAATIDSPGDFTDLLFH